MFFIVIVYFYYALVRTLNSIMEEKKTIKYIRLAIWSRVFL